MSKARRRYEEVTLRCGGKEELTDDSEGSSSGLERAEYTGRRQRW